MLSIYCRHACMIEPFFGHILVHTCIHCTNYLIHRELTHVSRHHADVLRTQTDSAKLIRYWTRFCFEFYSHCCIDIPTYKAWILKDSEKDKGQLSFLLLSLTSTQSIWPSSLQMLDGMMTRGGGVIVEVLYFEYLRRSDGQQTQIYLTFSIWFV